MKRLIVSLVMGLALAATPAISATQSATKAPAKQKSLAQNGRFHQIHAKKFAMECGTCHTSEHAEVLLQVPRAKVVDRQLCLDCHKKGNKPAWYGVVAR
jgi:uncharacterized membrane protein